MAGDTASLTALCVLPDERRAVRGWLCPAGPQLVAGHRRRPAAQRSLREASVHPGWLHADSSRQVTRTWLFGVEGQGFPGVLLSHPGLCSPQHPGSQQQEALANPNQCWDKREQREQQLPSVFVLIKQATFEVKPLEAFSSICFISRTGCHLS